MGQQEKLFHLGDENKEPFSDPMGLSCAVVEMGASSTGKGLAQVCTGAELGSRPEQRCKADFFKEFGLLPRYRICHEREAVPSSKSSAVF